MWIQQFYLAYKNGRKQFALLIDPDKTKGDSLDKTILIAESCGVDFFLVGGSKLLNGSIEYTIDFIKARSDKKIVLFPGSPSQLSNKADGLLLLSLISGRNPDLLIGHHVYAAQQIKKSGIEVMPTGYILIDGGRDSAVRTVSNTKPILNNNMVTAVSTALAGQQLGMKTIYLEAGSGALNSVPLNMIEQVKKEIDVPLWIGGGIKTAEQAFDIAKAGADIVVVGNVLEEQPELMPGMVEAVHSLTVKAQQQL